MAEEERKMGRVADRVPAHLRPLFIKLTDILPTKTHKKKFKTYKNSFTGAELVKFMVDNDLAEDESLAIKACNDLHASGALHHVTHEYKFENKNYLYQLLNDSDALMEGWVYKCKGGKRDFSRLYAEFTEDELKLMTKPDGSMRMSIPLEDIGCLELADPSEVGIPSKLLALSPFATTIVFRSGPTIHVIFGDSQDSFSTWMKQLVPEMLRIEAVVDVQLQNLVTIAQRKHDRSRSRDKRAERKEDPAALVGRMSAAERRRGSKSKPSGTPSGPASASLQRTLNVLKTELADTKEQLQESKRRVAELEKENKNLKLQLNLRSVSVPTLEGASISLNGPGDLSEPFLIDSESKTKEKRCRCIVM